jgi:uncharacterized protein (UPF0276 family)
MQAIPSAGLGLKPEHYADALAAPADGIWFEVHAENYMVEGGPRLAWLQAIRDRHPVSLHGVGLSLAADAAPDPAHLARLADIARRCEPFLISEHLAWSAWRGQYHPDLLPFPRTTEALRRIVDNVQRTQDAVGRRIAIENPSHYLRFPAHEWDEIAFLTEVARRTGCGLLLDVNNVHVSARNLGHSAEAYIDAFPAALVTEVHVAGHTADPSLGAALLIDSHDAPVARDVWALLARLVARSGPRPTLLERDGNVPSFAALDAERAIAAATLRAPLLTAA